MFKNPFINPTYSDVDKRIKSSQKCIAQTFFYIMVSHDLWADNFLRASLKYLAVAVWVLVYCIYIIIYFFMSFLFWYNLFLL